MRVLDLPATHERAPTFCIDLRQHFDGEIALAGWRASPPDLKQINDCSNRRASMRHWGTRQVRGNLKVRGEIWKPYDV